VRQLAEIKSLTSVISHPGDSSVDMLAGLAKGGVKGKNMSGKGAVVKENEQNVRNRAREVTFGKAIEK
jgi:hypothetical protein